MHCKYFKFSQMFTLFPKKSLCKEKCIFDDFTSLGDEEGGITLVHSNPKFALNSTQHPTKFDPFPKKSVCSKYKVGFIYWSNKELMLPLYSI